MMMPRVVVCRHTTDAARVLRSERVTPRLEMTPREGGVVASSSSHERGATAFLGEAEKRRRRPTPRPARIAQVGHIVGLGDRHAHNILVDTRSAEVVHIDFGVTFEQGKALATPETVPFRCPPPRGAFGQLVGSWA